MKSRQISFLIAFWLLSPIAALALPSKITEVAVYADRAQVTRTAKVTVKRGDVELIFQGLPASMDDRSVQAWGTGSVSATLEGVTVEMEPPPEVPEGKLGELTSRIEELKDRKKLLLEKRKAIESRLRMLADVRPETGRPEDKTSWGNLAEIEKIILALVTGLRDAYTELRATETELKRLDKEISALERELRKIRNPSGSRTKMITINLSVTRPGSMKIMFSYILPGATWRPLYDIRALPDEGEVEITGHAQIVQRTGEDWTGVSLSVSTAKPHVGGTAPELDPIYLVFRAPPPPPPPPPPLLRMEAPAMPAPMEMEMDGEPEELAVEEEEAIIEIAEVRRAGTAVFFEIKQRKTIPSDGEPHRVPIAVDRIEAQFIHASWPEARSLAFLRAKTTNTTGHPFVEGDANVFVGPSFIGTTRLHDWAPTEEKTISLGVDQGIRVKRKLIKKDEKESGSKRSILYEYNIEARNFKRKSVTIELFDRVPTSRQGDIEIKAVEIEPEPTEQKDNGILMWRLELEPDAKIEIRFTYTVRFPKNRQVMGLP